MRPLVLVAVSALLALGAAEPPPAASPYAPGELLRYRLEVSRTQSVRGLTRLAGEGVFLVDLVVTERLDGERVRLAGTCRPEGEPADDLASLCPETLQLDAPADPLALPGLGPWRAFSLRPPEDLDPEDPDWGDEGAREDERGAEDWSLRFRHRDDGWIDASLSWSHAVTESLFPRTTKLDVNSSYRLQGGRVAEARLLGVHNVLPFQVEDRVTVHLRRRPAEEE